MATDLKSSAEADVTLPDYEALLRALDGGSLAWLANRMTDAPTGHTWITREEAVGAVLDAHERMKESDPRSDLLRRFFRVPNHDRS